MRRGLIPLGLALCLGGCSFTGEATTDLTGLGVGAAVGALTGNPFIGLGAGIASRWAAGEGVRYVERELHQVVQDQIAEIAGPLAVGDHAAWSADPGPLIGRQSGEVEVVRSFGRRFPCKEIVFTVADDPSPEFFVGTICRGPQGWRWAVAEPSVERWGSLQ